MKAHELKTHPAPFQAVIDGLKTHEWRKDDRKYEVADRLDLREWDPTCTRCGQPAERHHWFDLRDEECRLEARGYTGREAAAIVTHISRGAFGIPGGYCVMSIALIQPRVQVDVIDRLRDLVASLAVRLETSSISTLTTALQEIEALRAETTRLRRALQTYQSRCE